MRMTLVWVLVMACGSTTSENAAPPTPSPSAATPTKAAPLGASAKRALARHHITMLQPDADVEKRITAIEPAANTLIAAEKLIADHDAAHPGVLPDVVDVAVVMRSTGTRAWLYAERKEIVIPELQKALSALPAIAVREKNVAMVMTLARPDAPQPETSASLLPPSWSEVAKQRGTPMSVDDIIDVVFPP